MMGHHAAGQSLKQNWLEAGLSMADDRDQKRRGLL
jgi:hypothetical protein